MTRLLVCLCLAFCGLNIASAQPRFAQAASDLKPDPAARFSVLPNGVRSVVLANKEPRERASLRLVVLAGSLNETEEQRGLAHFLEHMAFNGSTHYPPGTLVEYFQRLGMSFGGDTNAYTGFDQTVYQLELPDTQPGTLAEGFKVFADYAGGLLLQDKEIDRERGIILSEKRTRDSVEFRTFVAEFEFLLGESLFPKRLPIGAVEVIEKAPRERFVDFYNTWYRPDRLAVVAVGDFDPVAVEQQIAAAFGSLAPRAPARPAPDRGRVTAVNGVRAYYHAEPEAAATSVSIQTVTPYAAEPDTIANRLKDLPRSLATSMVNRRLSILAKKEGAPFSRGSLSVSESFDFFRNASIDLTCKPEQWAAALAVADQELRRALDHGFQPPELREVVANFINALEQAVKTAPTRRSESLASELVDAIVNDSVFTTPADELALLKPALTAITVDQCVAALREAFGAAHRYVSVTGNAKIEGDAAAAITQAYETSRATAVEPGAQLADATFAYTDFGTPSTPTKREHVADLDLHLLTFANGVRLNLKKTDFEAGRIRVGVRIGTGQLTEPKDKPGLGFFAGATFAPGGLGRHDVDDLQRILAGKNVGAGFNVAGDALVFNGNTNRDDLLLQLQLITAFITDAGYRPEALRQAHKSLDQLYTRLAHVPNGPLQLEVPRLLASGDPRFGLPTREQAFARTLEEVKDWLTPQFTTGAIEIGIVGDFDLEATVTAVSQTLGALPRRSEKLAHEDLRKVAMPAEPFTKDYTVPTEIPKGIIAIYWPTTDAREVKIARRLNLLGEVFSDRLRLKVREELGGAYSPGAGSSPSDTYRDYGFLLANVTVDPAKAGEIAEAVLTIARDLYENGVTEDEVDRAKKPILTGLRESARTNAYWLGSVVGSAQEMPQRLDWSRTRYSDNEAITKAELDALAKTYLDPKRASRVIVLPAAK